MEAATTPLPPEAVTPSASPKPQPPVHFTEDCRSPQVSSTPQHSSTSPPPSPSFLSLDRQSLSLILQHLPWHEKLVEASHLCRALPPLEAEDFCCDWPFLGDLASRPEWRLPHGCVRIAVIRASPRLQQLFSHVHHLTGYAKMQPLSDALQLLVCPPSPTDPSPFSRLRSLQLQVASDEGVFARLFPSSAAFPALEELDLCVRSCLGQVLTVVDREALLPLDRLPRLRRLEMTVGYLRVDGFRFLCTLPLTRLWLQGCAFSGAYEWVHTCPTVGPISGVPVTWEQVRFPAGAARDDGLVYNADIALPALAGYADSIAAAAQSDAPFQPRLQRLHFGWSLSARCLETVARIPSLTALTDARMGFCEDSAALDVSPLVSTDLQPLLPRLQAFEFPIISDVSYLSDPAMTRLVDSSAAFLTAYSLQLKDLGLMFYWRDSVRALLVAALHCSQLTSLRLDTSYGEEEKYIPWQRVVAEDLDPAVASLPPLRALTDLAFGELTLGKQALRQLLGQCPAVTQVRVWANSPHCNSTVELEGGRQVGFTVSE